MLELSYTHKDQSEDRIEMRIEGEMEADSEARGCHAFLPDVFNHIVPQNVWFIS